MTSDTIRVVARLKARPDKVEALHAVLFGLLAATRAKQVDAHFASEHIREALAQFPDLLADELDVRVYSLVG